MRRFVVCALLLGVCHVVLATDYNGSSFISRDPVIDVYGGNSTSSNFQNIIAGGQVAIGESTSSNFILRSGFLYFTDLFNLNLTKSGNGFGSVVSSPSGINCLVACTSANATFTSSTVVTLTATPATDSVFNGWGGACTGIGTCVITMNSSYSVTATFTFVGGGGCGQVNCDWTINFSGIAFPNGIVTLLQDSQIVATSTTRSIDGGFSLSVSGSVAGNYVFGIYASDLDCRQSSIISYNLYVPPATTINIKNIFISPTIIANKSEVAQGGIITFFGYTVPVVNVALFISGKSQDYGIVQSQTDGRYFHYFNTLPLPLGQYVARTRASTPTSTSAMSLEENFTVGVQDVFKSIGSVCGLCKGRGDLNSDCRVDLVDFSIAAFWWQRPLSPTFRLVEVERLNGDGVVDLTDFSIMAYYWTG